MLLILRTLYCPQRFAKIKSNKLASIEITKRAGELVNFQHNENPQLGNNKVSRHSLFKSQVLGLQDVKTDLAF